MLREITADLLAKHLYSGSDASNMYSNHSVVATLLIVFKEITPIGEHHGVLLPYNIFAMSQLPSLTLAQHDKFDPTIQH